MLKRACALEKRKELGTAEKNAALYYKKNAVLQERTARRRRAPSMRNPKTLPSPQKKKPRTWMEDGNQKKRTSAWRAKSAACGA
jgi:hypothetical protein